MFLLMLHVHTVVTYASLSFLLYWDTSSYDRLTFVYIDPFLFHNIKVSRVLLTTIIYLPNFTNFVNIHPVCYYTGYYMVIKLGFLCFVGSNLKNFRFSFFTTKHTKYKSDKKLVEQIHANKLRRNITT